MATLIREKPSLEIGDEQDARIDDVIARLEGIDPCTAVHSRMVGTWCVRLARTLNLDAAQRAYMYRAGLVHDIGKIAVPRAILVAPRLLTSAERAAMERHVIAGTHLIAGIKELTPFTDAVRSHHERYDGKGYPEGVRGRAIPFSARVVAVADSFNAMTGVRPYRRPIDPHSALEELARGRGTQFDPDVVDAMAILVLGSED